MSYGSLTAASLVYLHYCKSNHHLTLAMITRQKEKKQKAFAGAYTEYVIGLNQYSFFKVGNRALSEDLVQDTFLKTWNYLLSDRKIDAMKAFLYHILNNLIVDEYRKHKTNSLDALMEKGFEPSNTNDPERISDILDGKVALLLIERLPKKYRNVMNMHYVQDLSSKEISFLTGRSRNAIAVQTHRGLGKLRSLYGPAAIHV